MIYRGRYTPFDHQKTTAEFLYERDRAFCLNDIGTGKTLSALWAMDNRMRQGHNKRVLIITPKSTINYVWGREIYQSFKDYNTVELVGSRAKRTKLLDTMPDIAIINPNYAALNVVIDHEWSNGIDLIIVDEFTAFKTHTTNAHKNLKALIRKDATLWMMSGSPMPQAPTDIWAPAKLVCPDEVHKTFGRFRDWSMFKVSDFIWKPRPNIEEKIADLIKDYSIRFTRDDCLDLPPSQYIPVHLEPTDQQVEVEKKLKRDALIMLEDGMLTAVNEGVFISKMLQSACGAVKYTDSDGNATSLWVDCTPKLEYLRTVLDATTQPVILFSPFKAPIELLAAWAKREKIPFDIVHGGIPQRRREEAFDKLNNGSIKLLIAQPDCMSHGLTLTNSNVICWWGLPNKTETYLQANGRIIRAGQTRHQLIYHLLCTQFEHRVMSRLEGNTAMQGMLLELLAQK